MDTKTYRAPARTGPAQRATKPRRGFAAIHDQLETDFGIQMGELVLGGRDPREPHERVVLSQQHCANRQRGQS